MKPLVLFDFDGTIANTLPTIILILNKHHEYYGYKKITPRIIKQLRDKTLRDIVKLAGISSWKLFFIVRRCKKELQKQLENIHPAKGIALLLRELHKNYRIGIMTSNSPKNVFTFLTLHGLKSDEIHGNVKLFSKAKKLKKLKPLAYIGDEIRDIEACKKANIPIIAVTWGFNSENALNDADYIVKKPSELSRILAKIGNKLK